MSEDEKDAYLKLGIISTKFAEIEYYTELILSILISRDNELFSLTIIGNYSLQKKLDLLKDLIKLKDISRVDIEAYISTVKGIKNQRNQLIHGVWEKPIKGNTGYTISVKENKIKKEIKGNAIWWSFQQYKSYSKVNLELLIKKLELSINLAKNIETYLTENQEWDF